MPLRQRQEVQEVLPRQARAGTVGPASAPETLPAVEIAELAALFDAARFEEVENRTRLLLKRHPESGFAWKALGVSLESLGRDGLPALRKATELMPDDADAHGNLGLALKNAGLLDDAATSYRRAIALQPDSAHAHNNLGNVLFNRMQMDEAAASYRRALALQPDFAKAHNNLGNVLKNLGQLDEAAASYRRALARQPDFAQAHSNLLFCLSHSAAMGAQELSEEHRRFAEQFESPLRSQWPQHRNARDPERRLQVGFVSADLRDHAVAHFVEPVLGLLAASPQLSLHAYYNHRIEDRVTLRLKRHFTHWHAVASLSDVALAQRIRDDDIDILVDLSGHTSLNRLMTFARKPAPIQVSWIGYPNTTGLQAVDYVLSDRFNAPHGLHEPYYVEKFARLPSSGCFVPQSRAPEVSELPALRRGHVTFASFNRPEKLGAQVLAAWAKVLLAVPNSVMLLGHVSDAPLAQRLTQSFGELGIAAERLVFRPRVSLYDYLELHNEVDLILDTWPYTGGTTTNYALCMGVPVVTLLGPMRSHCQSAAVLGRSGLADWVARDVDEFVRIAVRWGHALPELAQLRAGLRERWQSAPLQQPATVARGMELAFRHMWRHWCAGLPAEHFEIEQEAISAPSLQPSP